MDQIDIVPKKIHRHVIKALNYLDIDEDKYGVKFSTLYDQVKHQMINLAPVAGLEKNVRKTLDNLVAAGLVKIVGCNRFSITRIKNDHSSQNMSRSTPIFMQDEQKEQRKDSEDGRLYNSKVDPNRKRKYDSDDSLSGDEMNKANKRLRTSKKLKRSGREVLLPKVQQRDELGNNSFSDDELMTQEINTGILAPGTFPSSSPTDNCPNEELFSVKNLEIL